MGRTVKSQGLAPPAVRKDIRAKQARHIVNKVVPAILASNSRARIGSENSQLIVNPESEQTVPSQNITPDAVAYVKRKGQGRRKAKIGSIDDGRIDAKDYQEDGTGRKRVDSGKSAAQNFGQPSASEKPPCRIRIAVTDTLTAAKLLQEAKSHRKSANTCILNMASPLRPGGGVLAGATSQEEFLCARTTLLPSLKEEYYRLPELGGIWTPDVQVFRNASPLNDTVGELPPTERFWVDVISAGMLRFPELEGEEEEIKTLSRKDRQIVEDKMRAVLRIAAHKNVRKLVLGAWGCGAYGNPVHDIAQAWRKVLNTTASTTSKSGSKEDNIDQWPALEEVVFAISSRKMAAEFAQAFGGDIALETDISSIDTEAEDEEEDEGEKVAQELKSKIEEIEGQIDKVWNPELRSRLTIILEGLRAQLKEREDDVDSDSEAE